jgi:hypothetical protein
VPAIFGIEAATGALLRRLIGSCPWDYTGRRAHVRGLVRLDYAPLWYLVGLAFERLHAGMLPRDAEVADQCGRVR